MQIDTPYRTNLPEPPVFIAVDSETTGKDPETAEAVEAAAYSVEARAHTSSTFKPSLPIPPEAMAIHHITNEQVNDAPPYGADWLDWAVSQLNIRHENAVFVAHNAAYDAPILDPERAYPWVCTYRLSLHLLPNAPTHSNQGLRYVTGIKPDLPEWLYPHRALYDAIVTGDLFRDALLPAYQQGMGTDDEALRNISRFATQSARLTGEIKFGKHRGTAWDAVPSRYLHWIIRQGENFDPDVAGTARAIVEERRG